MRDLSIIETPPVDRQAIRTYRRPRHDERADPRRDPPRARARRAGLLRAQPRRVDRADRARICASSCPRRASASRTGRWTSRRSSSVMLDFLEKRRRRAGDDRDHRVGPRHPEREHDPHRPRRHVRARAALPAPRPRRPLARARVRVPAHARARRCSPATRRSGSRCSPRSTTSAAAFGSRCTISRSAAPGNLARQAAVGAGRGRRLRALHADARGGDPRAPRRAGPRRGRAGDPARHLGVPARGLRRGREPAPGALQAPGARDAREELDELRRDGRPLRPGSGPSAVALSGDGSPPLSEGARVVTRLRRQGGRLVLRFHETSDIDPGPRLGLVQDKTFKDFRVLPDHEASFPVSRIDLERRHRGRRRACSGRSRRRPSRSRRGRRRMARSPDFGRGESMKRIFACASAVLVGCSRGPSAPRC